MSYYPDDDSQYSDYTDATEQSAEVRSEEGPKSVGSWSTTSCSSSSSASETSETTRTTATTATTATSYRYANRHLTQPEKQSHSWMDGLWSWYLNDGKGERDRQKDADDDCSSVVTADIAKISLESEIKDHSVRIRGHRDEEISVSCHHRHKDADGDCSSVVAVDITTTNHGSEIRDHSLRVRGHILDKGNSISESEKRGDSTYKKLKRKTTKKDRYDTHDDCDDLSQATVDSGNVASNYVQRKYRNRSRVSREERDDRSLGEKQNEVNAGSSDSVASKHSRKKNWVQSLVPIAEGDNKSRGEPNQNFNADESDSIVPKYSRRKKRARPRVSKAEEDDRSLGDQSQELTAGHSDSVEPNYSQRLNKVISLVSRIERNDRSLLAEQQKKRSWQNPFGHKAKELPPRPARITGIHQRHHPSSTKKINERPSSSTSTGGPVEPNSIDLIPNHAAASQPRLLGAGEKFAYPKLAVDFISNVPTGKWERRFVEYSGDSCSIFTHFTSLTVQRKKKAVPIFFKMRLQLHSRATRLCNHDIMSIDKMPKPLNMHQENACIGTRILDPRLFSIRSRHEVI